MKGAPVFVEVIVRQGMVKKRRTLTMEEVQTGQFNLLGMAEEMRVRIARQRDLDYSRREEGGK